MSHQITLSDGRKQDFLITGDPNGFPLFFIHGTPGSQVPPVGFPEVCKKQGLKCITLSRAGYGSSTRKQGRSIVDCVADLEEIKKHLGIEKCVVGGWSGGGPHALACAARLSGCYSALVVASPTPYDLYTAEGHDWLEGQGEDNIQEIHASMQGEQALRGFVEPQREEMLKMTAADFVSVMGSLLPEPDRKALMENEECGQNTIELFKEGLRLGADGWIDDDLAFLKPWGFDLAEIKIPVFLWQGDLDLMVPYSQGKWFASHLPKDKVVPHLLEGEGHISIFLGRAEEMVGELVATIKS